MLLPIDFVLARTAPSWRELLVALDRGWLQPRDALTLAHHRAAQGESSEALDALLALGPGDRLLPAVMALAHDEPEQEPSAMLQKWGDLVLAWTWHYREALADPLATIADVWGDFDFPVAWEPFIHYLEPPDGDVAREAARRAALTARWESHVANTVGLATA
jgi:hypothetical protein